MSLQNSWAETWRIKGLYLSVCLWLRADLCLHFIFAKTGIPTPLQPPWAAPGAVGVPVHPAPPAPSPCLSSSGHALPPGMKIHLLKEEDMPKDPTTIGWPHMEDDEVTYLTKFAILHYSFPR